MSQNTRNFIFNFLMIHSINFLYCFNLDTKFPIIYVDPSIKNASNRPSYFGYSSILYSGKSRNATPWIQIGAPRGSGVIEESGIVFKCNIFGPCNASDLSVFNGKGVEGNFSNAWIGASMSITDKFNEVAVCASRYKSNGDRMEGACFLKNIEDKQYKFNSPIYDTGTAFSQTGMSSHYTEFTTDSEIIAGAPGTNNGMGTAILYRTEQSSKRQIVGRLGKNGRYYNYFGYSVSSGRFLKSFKSKFYYVSGAPKDGYCGRVYIFQYSRYGHIVIHDKRTGSTIGEYFGASLAVADVNNDNIDDLFVGAPHYAVKGVEGRVYTYLGTGNRQSLLTDDKILEGKMPGGQFGLAIQTLGDLNGDGYSDIAVGAPYENDKRGAIYIYNGGKNGINTLSSQRIAAEDFAPDLRAFGISFSNAVDIDNNNINDLAIGAYLSGHVVLLRTQPVVKINVDVETSLEQLNRMITNFTVKICFSYEGLHLPKSLNIDYKMQVDPAHKRTFINNQTVNRINNYVLIEKQKQCENYTINIKPGTNEAVPITILLKPTLSKETSAKEKLINWIGPSGVNKNTNDKFCKDCPVTHLHQEPETTTISIPFTLDCGRDEKCEPNLKVTAKFKELSSNRFVIGFLDELILQVDIENTGEHAYLTNLQVTLPDNVYLKEISDKCEYKGNTNVCHMDRLDSKMSQMTTMLIDMKDVINAGILTFFVNASSRGIELDAKDNSYNITLYLFTEADIQISGKGGENLFYTDINEIVDVQQLYEVKKTGASPLDTFTLEIHIPTKIRDINFLEIYEPIGNYLDHSFSCRSDETFKQDNFNEARFAELQGDGIGTDITGRTKRSTENKKIINTTEILLPSSERALFLNCSINEVTCTKISCVIGPFTRSSSAILTLKMSVQLKSLEILMGIKDIIYLSTDGDITENKGTRYNSTRISSMILGEAKQVGVELWVILVSFVGGLLILLLIILGLIKAGFFVRKEKEQLNALKEAEVIEEFTYETQEE